MNEFDKPMRKIFNVAGPCNPCDHYMLPATARLPEVIDLICGKQYFVIHASRQSGKTTALKSLTARINQSESMNAIYCSLEAAQEITDLMTALKSIASLILGSARVAKIISLTDTEIRDFCDALDISNAVKRTLEFLCESRTKSLVVFFDEADCLPETVLISFLRQLRDGYVNRTEQPFPSSLALVGMRRIQDYKVQVRQESKTLGTASPFNITRESLTLRNFNQDEVEELYKQHTMATGQKFEDGVCDEVMSFTGGQPWLVNAIAAECVEKIHRLNYDEIITVEDIRSAKETIIRRRDTHILWVLDIIKNEKIMSVVNRFSDNRSARHVSWWNYQDVLDFGIWKEECGSLIPSNQMYSEIISAQLG